MESLNSARLEDFGERRYDVLFLRARLGEETMGGKGNSGV